MFHNLIKIIIINNHSININRMIKINSIIMYKLIIKKKIPRNIGYVEKNVIFYT